ncbi:MAG TPA: hypothetical protein VIT92_07505 [Burkholderiaceae bacterium]
MLTSTYAMVAFSVEQAMLRNEIVSCRLQAREQLRPGGAFDNVLAALDRVQRLCQWRKLELYLLPALRQAGRAAEDILQEAAAMGQRAAQILASLRTRVAGALYGENLAPAEVGAAAELYCLLQLERLKHEEKSLFPLAQRVLSSENWFAIARQLMLCESGRDRAAVRVTVPSGPSRPPAFEAAAPKRRAFRPESEMTAAPL